MSAPVSWTWRFKRQWRLSPPRHPACNWRTCTGNETQFSFTVKITDCRVLRPKWTMKHVLHNPFENFEFGDLFWPYLDLDGLTWAKYETISFTFSFSLGVGDNTVFATFLPGILTWLGSLYCPWKGKAGSDCGQLVDWGTPDTTDAPVDITLVHMSNTGQNLTGNAASSTTIFNRVKTSYMIV